jgi:hypothetical protein
LLALALALGATVLALSACRVTPRAAGGPDGPTVGGQPPVGVGAPSRRAGPIIMRTERGRYERGAVVNLIVTNLSDGTVTIQFCSLQLERDAAGVWEPVLTGGAGCVPGRMAVLPRGFVRQPVALPDNIPSGRYRFRQEVETTQGIGYYSVMSNTFAVD